MKSTTSFFILLLFILGCNPHKETITSSYKLIPVDSIKLNFPESMPQQSGAIFRIDNGNFLYLIRVAPNEILVFNSSGDYVKKFGGIGKEPDLFPFYASTLVGLDNSIVVFTGALMHTVKLDLNFNVLEKSLTRDAQGNEVFRKFRIANNSYGGFADNERDIMILPIESNSSDPYSAEFYNSNTIGIFSTDGNMLSSFGKYGQVFFDHQFLVHRNLPSMAYDHNRGKIYSTHTGSSIIGIFNVDGEKVGEINHQGNSIIEHDIQGIKKEEEPVLWKDYWNQHYFYNELYFDKTRDQLYRIYVEDTPKDKAKNLEHVYLKEAFLEVFKKDKFVGELPFPSKLSWDIIDIDPEGNIYFRSKYFWQKEDGQDIYIYKYQLSVTDSP